MATFRFGNRRLEVGDDFYNSGCIVSPDGKLIVIESWGEDSDGNPIPVVMKQAILPEEMQGKSASELAALYGAAMSTEAYG